MNRTLLAFLVLIPAVFAVGVPAVALGLEGWALTGVGVVVGMLVTLIDREGFYGPRAPRSR